MPEINQNRLAHMLLILTKGTKQAAKSVQNVLGNVRKRGEAALFFAKILLAFARRLSFMLKGSLTGRGVELRL